MGQNEATKVLIQYSNHVGVTALRIIEPVHMYFGFTEWHPEPQWMLKAFDHGIREWRDFAMKDITRWEAVTSNENKASSKGNEILVQPRSKG